MKKNFNIFSENDGDDWFWRNKSRLESKQSIKYAKVLTEWLFPFKKEINKILEIGCGSGHQLNYIAKILNSKAYGVDISSDALKYIKKKFPKINVKKSNGNKVPYRNNFDLVNLGFVLMYMNKPQLIKHLDDIFRLVKPGKFLSVMDFDTPYNYVNIYKHNKNIRIYKRDNVKVLLSSGHYTLVNKFQMSHDNLHFSKEVDERICLALLYKEK